MNNYKNENKLEAEHYYNLKLHQTKTFDQFRVTRVIGGWVYANKFGATFVPFSNEFQ